MRINSRRRPSLEGGFQPRIFIKDMKRAYRQVAVMLKHLGFSIIAVYCPEQGCWLFAELLALAFGLAARISVWVGFSGSAVLKSANASGSSSQAVALYLGDLFLR